MTSLSHRPSPWLLAPAAAALVLLGFAHHDMVFPSICLLGIISSYFHPWRASLPKRHPWFASILTCAALFALCLLYYWFWLLNGEGLTYFRRFWYKPWLVSTGAMLQAAILLWVWHLPRNSTGLIFVCMGLIAISSGNLLPSSYGIVNLYALFGGACLLSLFALSGAFNAGRDQPFGEQCRQSLAVLTCIAVIGTGTWYISTSLQHVGQLLDTLLADFMSGSLYRDTIGAGDSIHIAHQRQVRLSRRVVATISGNRSPVYLRTQVMTQYHQHRWTPSPTQPPRPLDSSPSTPASGLPRREVRLHVNLQGAVPLPYGVSRVHTPEPLSCLQTAGALVQCAPSSQLTSYAFEVSPTDETIPYGIGFALRAQPAGASPPDLAASLQHALSGPEAILSQLRPIARRITGTDPPHALAAAQAIQQYFRQHFSYSLHVNLTPELDPIVDFVRHRRPAYCEYFASGMALMLRALGIPARVAGGFLVWEYNALLQQWVVRQRDAHAWVEVYDDAGQRWVGFDATPAFRQERFSRTGLAGLLDQSRAWIELQLRSAVKQLYQIDFIAWFMRLRQLKNSAGLIAGQSVVFIVSIAFAYWLWRRFHVPLYQWWKRLKCHVKWPSRQRPSSPIADPVQAEVQHHFARVVSILQQQGLPISPAETLGEYRQRLSSRDHAALIECLSDFSYAYHQLRFRPWPEEPASRRLFFNERLIILRRATDQIQQWQRDREAIQPSSV